MRRVSSILLVLGATLLMVGSATTYVEAKPQEKPPKAANSKGPKDHTTGKPSTTPTGGTPNSTSGSGVKNSGTIKVAQVGSGTEPNNEPHPGCTFRVDFYGFRAGTLALTISAISPTGDGTLATDSVTISRDARGSRYQTSRTYDVSSALAGYTAAQQGYHLRVDAKRTDSNGQGSKTKVFWLDCAPDAEVGGTFVERGRARVLGISTGTGAYRIDGRRVATTDGRLEVLGVSLARTGAPLIGLSLLAVAFLLLGGGLLLRQPTHHLSSVG